MNRPRLLFLTTVVVTACASMLVSAPPAVADSATVTYAGSAYGSAVRLGTLVRSGHTSQVSICTPTGNSSNTNNTGIVTLPGVGRIGAVVTLLRAVASPAPQSVADSRTNGTNLFSGMIRAQEIVAHGSVTQNGDDYATAGYSTITGLLIAGRHISAHPAPNTSIGLPGIGRVVLNQQRTSSTFGLTSISVTAIVVTVSPGNNRSLPPGTIVISSATAGLHRPTFNRAVGDAYATSARAGQVLKSGETAYVSIACGGNDGQTSRNNIESTVIPDVLTTGTASTTATSNDSATATTTRTSARVQGVTLFGGQVHASAVFTRATATLQDGTETFNPSGTTFTNLVINGQAVSGTPPRNSSYSLPGIGTVYLNVVTVNGRTVHAQGMRIVLDTPQGDLPAGAVINVAVADAGVNN